MPVFFSKSLLARLLRRLQKDYAWIASAPTGPALIDDETESALTECEICLSMYTSSIRVESVSSVNSRPLEEN